MKKMPNKYVNYFDDKKGILNLLNKIVFQNIKK